MILINNGKLMKMEGAAKFAPGYVILDSNEKEEAGKGIILSVGSGNGVDKFNNICDEKKVPEENRIILDAGGGYISPGLIEPHGHIGLWEDGQRSETGDGNEMSDPVTSQIRAVDAVNPLDPCFKEAVEGGITSVMTGPGSANVIGGTFVFMKTWGNSIDKMLVKQDAAMKAALGENPKGVYGSRKNIPGTRMGNAAVLRETLFKAKKYLGDKENAALKKNDAKEPEFNLKYEALIPVLKKEMILKIHAHRADDILTAIRICKEFDLVYTLDHCTEGYLIAEHLQKEYNEGNLLGVLTGPLMSDRSKPELSKQSIKNPGILANKGIKTAILTDHPVIPVQYLPVNAAVACREGMNEYDALKSITITAAELAGVGDKMGSIKEGKHGDIVVFTGHPFDYKTKVLYTIIDGNIRYSAN